MNNLVFNSLIGFILRERGTYNFKLTPDLYLENDLGIYGEDANDFIEAFSIEFNVDVSKFDANVYFNAEGFQLFKRKKTNVAKKSLRLLDLEFAIINKKLE